MECKRARQKLASEEQQSTKKLLHRFSSIKLNYEKIRRRTICNYQQQGLQVPVAPPNLFQDKKEIRKQLRASVDRYSLPELYVKMILALFPQIKSREMPDSNALIQHLKQVFRLTDQEHSRLMDIARMTKLPQRIINLEIVEGRDIPAKDPNGLSDPFCVIYVNTRDVAQRTKVIQKTLNPVWKQYFTFKVNDINRDVLHIEVLDYNDQDEPLRDRIRRFKDIKSPGTFGILLKEIANTRPIQEHIGALKIPVSEISSETIERWFKLKNQDDQGEIYLRMALGYNKSREAATEEFLQIIHFLLVSELDKDVALEAPYYWDEHFQMWSKYILRQFKWQGGLKPKDIVLAKWRAYTTINAIFPLNANMMCLLLDAMLERKLNNEYDAREVGRFWDCTVCLVNTIVRFVRDVHDVLPCPVTVLHTYHMLKTIELLCQYLDQAPTNDKAKVPFTKEEVVDRVQAAVKEGANKFYLKVFSDSTGTELGSGDDDPLQLALERLLKMGQILHEDLRQGVATIQTDFKGILNVDYLTLTYQVYDEQFGKMVKYIVEEYNSNLVNHYDTELDEDQDLDMDENGPMVKAGVTVLKLYLAVKNLASLAPPNYVELSTSEFSIKREFHNWFFHSVATWIDTLRTRVMRLVKTTVEFEAQDKGGDKAEDDIFSKVDTQGGQNVPISATAVDTAQLFSEINKFWVSLGWEEPHQSYAIVRKLLEELYGVLIFYASQLLQAQKEEKLRGEQQLDETAIENHLKMSCVAINNINYVKDHVELLVDQLNISQITCQLELDEATSLGGGGAGGEYDASVQQMTTEMREDVSGLIYGIMQNCVKNMLPKLEQLLATISKSTGTCNFTTVKPMTQFMDNCWVTLKKNLEPETFLQFLMQLWTQLLGQIDTKITQGLEHGKATDYFQRYKCLTEQLHALFWPEEKSGFSVEGYQQVSHRLSTLEAPLAQLKAKYYNARYKRQQKLSSSSNELGSVTVKAGFVERDATVVVELLNARKLKSFGANNTSDSYAVARLVPSQSFRGCPRYTTKTQHKTLFPLFEETFKFPVTEEDRNQGFLHVALYNHKFIGNDDFMGEALLPLNDMTKLPSLADIGTLPQRHLALNKPEPEDLEWLTEFEQRVWDKEAVQFAKREKIKMSS